METQQSDKIDLLVGALVKVQGQLSAAPKKSENPFHKSKYSDLPTCWENCRGLLTANGLTVIQTGESIEGTVTLATTLAHTSGQWIRGRESISVGQEKTGNMNAQLYGSHQTYLRRYGLNAIIGQVTDEDDDGEGAEGRGTQTLGGYKQGPHSHPANIAPPPTTTAVPQTVTSSAPEPVPQAVTPVPAAEGTPEAEVGGGSDWRGMVVGFGKNKGTPLGELSVRSLAWYQNVENNPFPEGWQMKAKDDGTYWDSDIAFKAALDASLMEDGKKNEQ